jgi:recombination protein RecT
MADNLPATKAPTPVDRLKMAIANPTVQEQFRNAMAEKSNLFVASLIDLYAGDTYLQKCEPKEVIMEALKAATLDLPINKSLGFAWIIPRYNGKLKRYVPGFQIGWKGIVQLAQRTGQYRHINCGPVYEGELKKTDKLTGELDISGEATSEKTIGFFAYIELMTGFRKASYWTKEKVTAHAIRYNPECKKEGKLVGNWLDQFESRAMSTVLKLLISKYGIMSVEIASILAADPDEEVSPEDTVRREIEGAANQDFIDIQPEQTLPEAINTAVMSDAEKAEIAAMEAAQADQVPGY